MGQELGARYVLDGTVRKAGPTLRINVQLVDTLAGTHLWVETFDRNWDAGIFAVQDEITDRVVDGQENLPPPVLNCEEISCWRGGPRKVFAVSLQTRSSCEEETGGLVDGGRRRRQTGGVMVSGGRGRRVDLDRHRDLLHDAPLKIVLPARAAPVRVDQDGLPFGQHLPSL